MLSASVPAGLSSRMYGLGGGARIRGGSEAGGLEHGDGTRHKRTRTTPAETGALDPSDLARGLKELRAVVVLER